jgi:hypothetical protein
MRDGLVSGLSFPTSSGLRGQRAVVLRSAGGWTWLAAWLTAQS